MKKTPGNDVQVVAHTPRAFQQSESSLQAQQSKVVVLKESNCNL